MQSDVGNARALPDRVLCLMDRVLRSGSCWVPEQPWDVWVVGQGAQNIKGSVRKCDVARLAGF